MKFNKSILFTTLIASAVALTACNEEKKVAPANNAQATQEKKIDAHQDAKAQFEQAVKIMATKRALTKDAKGNATVSVTYDIENTGAKAIKAIHWISAYSFEGKILYVANLPLDFADAIPVKAKAIFNETTALENIPAEFRSTVENPNSNIQTVIGPMSIEFADGSKIIANK